MLSSAEPDVSADAAEELFLATHTLYAGVLNILGAMDAFQFQKTTC